MRHCVKCRIWYHEECEGPPAEHIRLKYLRKNILSKYRKPLALKEVSDISELSKLVKKLKYDDFLSLTSPDLKQSMLIDVENNEKYNLGKYYNVARNEQTCNERLLSNVSSVDRDRPITGRLDSGFNVTIVGVKANSMECNRILNLLFLSIRYAAVIADYEEAKTLNVLEGTEMPDLEESDELRNLVTKLEVNKDVYA
ncbi:hypothetical protein WA026_016549 [Henosepilachna vigintioctopunctata]|uniref:Uncharacterized protein n=1 Tax=Henosepilachna vigintioctopunctata TaxID=420089 RepID=A0AAW1VHM2_9CUCU